RMSAVGAVAEFLKRRPAGVVRLIGDFFLAEIFEPAVIVQRDARGQISDRFEGRKKERFGRGAVGELITEAFDAQIVGFDDAERFRRKFWSRRDSTEKSAQRGMRLRAPLFQRLVRANERVC